MPIFHVIVTVNEAKKSTEIKGFDLDSYEQDSNKCQVENDK